MSRFEKYLALWVALCMVIGVVLSQTVPGISEAIDSWQVRGISIPIGICLFLMMYPAMLNLQVSELKKLKSNPKPIVMTLFSNWVIAPLVAAGLAYLFLRGNEQLIVAVILLGSSPCTAMVLVWGKLTEGNQEQNVVNTSLNTITIMVLYVPIVSLLTGIQNVPIDRGLLVISTFVFIGIPLILGIVSKRVLVRAKGDLWFENTYRPIVGKIAIVALLVTLVVLFSLILALGMLVDNAIGIVENIFRFRVSGKSRDQAAREATHQVSAPVIASTLTTLCAFGPLILWPGIMGEFMKYLPITLIVTLSSSHFVALVFNPVLCARFMQVPKDAGDHKRPGDRLLEFGLKTYEPTIRWALRHRGLTLLGMLVLLVVVFMLFGRFNAGVELFPDVEPTYAYVGIEAPSGTRIEQTDTYCDQIEPYVSEVPELLAYVTEVGTGGSNGFIVGGSAATHNATLNLEFIKQEDRDTNSRQSLEDLRTKLQAFTGARLTIDKQEEGPPTGKPVTIEISGDDFVLLGDLASRIKDQIRDIPGLVDLQDDFDRGRPEIRVRPSLEKAARLGLRTIDLASTIRTAIHGDEVSTYRVGEDEYDIIVRLAESARLSTEDLENLTVFYEGEHIPITAFAEVTYEAGLGSIQRIDSERVVTVTADAGAGYNGNALLATVQGRIARFPMPPGYYLAYTGESQDEEEARAFLSDAFMIALMLMTLVLITQFTSLTIPFVIMASVVLSLIGVLVGLMVTRTPFGIIMTGVGVISLAGVVVNNAIVLLDYVIKLRAQGMEKMEALVQAGRTRFRPVVLTAITTILGLIPLTTGFSINFGNILRGDFAHAMIIGGSSSQWWGPMGTAVIWGLAVATFLTLVIVPVLYSVLDPIKRSVAFFFTGILLRPLRRSAPATPPN